MHVTLGARGDRSARIYRQLRAGILDGRLRAGERLPPTRDLASQLAVSRNTVATAYELLTAEGFVIARVGAGTYVAADRPEPPVGVGDATTLAGGPTTRSAMPRPRAGWEALIATSRPAATPVGPPPRFDFRVGAPDARLFPLAAWRRMVGRALEPALIGTGAYGDPAGDPALRAALARHVGVSRAVRARPEDIVVTSGAQQALDLAGRVLIEPGGCVAVEEPGYPPARRLFTALGAQVELVPVDADGLRVDALPDAARLVYVTPSHQFPLGVTMSMARRTALLAWAERHDAVVIEDDYDSEFRFGARPLEPLQALDRGGRVLYVGSFSKTLLPALRLGFLVAPPSLGDALRAAKGLADWHGDLPTQVAMAGFIDEGLLARHLRRARRAYQDRHERLVAAMDRELGAWLEVIPSHAGLHVCARLRAAGVVDVDGVVDRARAHGVAVERLDAYCAGEPQPGLVVGYGSIPIGAIDEGITRLGEAFRAGGVEPQGVPRPPTTGE